MKRGPFLFIVVAIGAAFAGATGVFVYYKPRLEASRALVQECITATEIRNRAEAVALLEPPAPTAPLATDTYGQWEYRQFNDELTGRPGELACMRSTNEIRASSFARAPSRGKLCLRLHPRMGFSAFLDVQGGHITCQSYDRCWLDVSFDSSDAERVMVNEASDHSRDSVFVARAEAFFEKLRASSRVAMQVILYDSGSPILVFENTNTLRADFAPPPPPRPASARPTASGKIAEPGQWQGASE